MTPDERAIRGVTVRALLADENVKAAFASIEQDLTDEWKAAHTVEERENIWRALNIMERLQVWLNSAASGDLTALRRAGMTGSR